MTVAKSGKGWVTKHCHGRKRGKVIARFKTKKAAMVSHRAIQAKKHK